jgi:hypothetical protein
MISSRANPESARMMIWTRGQAARIWELIATPRSVRAVRDVLLAEYEVDAERCEGDLLLLFQTMIDAGLVEVSDGTPG